MHIKRPAAYILVFTFGILFTNAYRVVTAYYRMPRIWNHGERLVSKIDAYKTQHGSYPSQVWFDDSLEETVTIEGRKWVYLSPPFKNKEGKDILIFTRVDYGDAYHSVCSGGDVRRIGLDALINKKANKTLHPTYE